MPPPKETLPDAAPMPTFFMPNFIGFGLAFALERLQAEAKLTAILPNEAHPFCLFGLGVFALSNCNSLLGGNVVNARVQHDVKLPNLYASKTEHKTAVEFNVVQRAHQNFLENYAHLALSALFTALVADRPHTAGIMLMIVSICRVLYARGYKSNISSRIPAFLLIVFTTKIGVGYGLMVGLTCCGMNLFAAKDE